jgi:hypothetical protein
MIGLQNSTIFVLYVRIGLSPNTEFCFVLMRVLKQKQKTELHNFAELGLNLLNEIYLKCESVPIFS